jgi:hypothetical protein
MTRKTITLTLRRASARATRLRRLLAAAAQQALHLEALIDRAERALPGRVRR